MRTLVSDRALCATLALAFVLVGCGTGGPAYSPATPGVDASIDMTPDLTFEPTTVHVPVGGTVEWRNKSPFTHTITADPAKVSDSALPAGARPFDSGDIPPGATYRQSFTVPGQYDYSCLPHDWLGMKGVVIVDAH